MTWFGSVRGAVVCMQFKVDSEPLRTLDRDQTSPLRHPGIEFRTYESESKRSRY